MKISVFDKHQSEDTHKVLCLSKDQGGWDSKKKGGKYLGQDKDTWKSINTLRMNLIYLCKGEALRQGGDSIIFPAVWKTKGRQLSPDDAWLAPAPFEKTRMDEQIGKLNLKYFTTGLILVFHTVSLSFVY